MPLLFAFYAFAIGAVVGSFLNVVIHRWPREESIVFPASHCPACNAPIKAYDNIPIVSYVVLLGRCRSCRATITPRYPLVELSNALFYLAIFQRTGVSIAFVPIAAIVSMLIVLIFIDADVQMLPDAVTLPGIAMALLIGAFSLGDRFPELAISTSIVDSAGGAIVGGAIIATIILTYWLVRRAEGMGWGDSKMLAMIGAALGWRSVFAVLFLGSLAGAIVGVPLALRSEKRLQMALPFGVFLGLAALITMFFGNTLFAWWVQLATR
jgi:leader peptidase (prepilin peptidase) / N-methyltransferase